MKPKSKRPNMQDVAKEAGVSRTTVSRGLRGDRSIPEKTRTRIKAIADRMGYHPNARMSQMMSELRSGSKKGNTLPIAAVSNWGTAEEWKKWPTSHTLFKGAQRRAQDLGYHFENFWLNDKELNSNRLDDILHHRGIEGVFLIPPRHASHDFNLNWKRLACATVGYSLLHLRLNRAVANNYHAAMLSVQKAFQYGYKRPAIVVSREIELRTEYRYTSGYIAGMRSLDFGPGTQFNIHDNQEDASVQRWFKKTKPDVIISNPLPSRWERLGLKFPDDCGYIALSLNGIAADCSCAGIEQHSELLGAAAIDLIHEQLASQHRGFSKNPKIVTLESGWVDGATLPKIVSKKLLRGNK